MGSATHCSLVCRRLTHCSAAADQGGSVQANHVSGGPLEQAVMRAHRLLRLQPSGARGKRPLTSPA